MKKRIFSFMMVLLLLSGLLSVNVLAEDTPAAPTYKVSANISAGSGSLKIITQNADGTENVAWNDKEVAAGETVTIRHSAASSDVTGYYIFHSWSADSGVQLGDPVDEKTSFTMPAADVNITVIYARELNDGNTYGQDITIAAGEIACIDGNILPAALTIEAGGILYAVNDGTVSLSNGNVFTNQGTILSGGYFDNVENNGTIAGGTFGLSVKNRGTISGGRFYEVENDGTISGGTFEGEVVSNGTISGGTFNGPVNGGLIHNGTFNGVVTNKQVIFGGSFAQPIADDGGVYSISGMASPTAGGTVVVGPRTDGGKKDYVIPVIATPARGYVFKNWTATCNAAGTTAAFADASAANTTITMPASPVTVTANFVRLYTVIYEADGQTVATKTVVEGDSVTDVPVIPDKEGHDGKWSHDGQNITKDMTITADYSLKTYTVTYEAEGKTADTRTVEWGKDVTKVPEVPAKEGHTGVWDKEAKAVKADMTVTAVYTPNSYTVTYEADGQTVATETVKYGQNVVNVPDVPAKEGHDGKWNHDGQNITKDMTIAADYSLKTFTVTYEAEGKTADTRTVEWGKDVTKVPEVPAKEGHTGVWDKEAKAVKADMTVTAVYTPNSYTVTYKAEGVVVDTETVKYGQDVANVPAVPAKEGHTGKWNRDGKNITGDTTIEAVYRINTYTVTYEADGKAVDTREVNWNDSVANAPAVPAKTGYTGVWEAEAKNVKADMTIKAVYTGNSYTVYFDVNGGKTPNPGAITVTYGAAYGKLPTAEHKELYFAGWYTAKEGGTRMYNTTVYNVDGNQTLYAHWSTVPLTGDPTSMGQIAALGGALALALAGLAGVVIVKRKNQ